MSGKLRLGVIGLGAIGLRHAALIAADPECRLAATADPATTLPGIAPFPDWAAMLAAVPLDGAIVATPNALHEPAALACIARGVPVLVEKPIADSIAPPGASAPPPRPPASRCWSATIAATPRASPGHARSSPPARSAGWSASSRCGWCTSRTPISPCRGGARPAPGRC